tara:strand:+ start:12040 stop:12573 length:534 start_codon:yes stop_codon:yes gene_type:complete
MRKVIRKVIKEFLEKQQPGYGGEGENQYFRRLFEWCKNIGFEAVPVVKRVKGKHVGNIPFEYDLYKDYDGRGLLDHRLKMRISTSVQSPYLDFDYAFVDFEEGEIGDSKQAIRFVSIDDSPGIELLSESDLKNIKDMIRRLDSFFKKTDADSLYEMWSSANPGSGDFNILVHAWTQK